MLLPIGIIVIIVGLIAREEAAALPVSRPQEEVLLDADLVTSEMEAILRKVMELSEVAKTNSELIDQYVVCLKDAKLRIDAARNIESSLLQLIEGVRRQLDATESNISSLERSKTVYGVQAESLEKKIAQEKAKLEGLRENAKRLEETLLQLRSKRDVLASILNRELEA